MLFAGCGAPVLRNMPRLDPAYVAGGAAAVAGALTLLDPDGAAANAEQAGYVPVEPPNVSQYVPEEAFDALDAAHSSTR